MSLTEQNKPSSSLHSLIGCNQEGSSHFRIHVVVKAVL